MKEVYILTDISPEDGYYKDRAKLIGKRFYRHEKNVHYWIECDTGKQRCFVHPKMLLIPSGVISIKSTCTLTIH